jgi:hypothetical protein
MRSARISAIAASILLAAVVLVVPPSAPAKDTNPLASTSLSKTATKPLAHTSSPPWTIIQGMAHKMAGGSFYGGPNVRVFLPWTFTWKRSKQRRVINDCGVWPVPTIGYYFFHPTKVVVLDCAGHFAFEGCCFKPSKFQSWTRHVIKWACYKVRRTLRRGLSRRARRAAYIPCTGIKYVSGKPDPYVGGWRLTFYYKRGSHGSIYRADLTGNGWFGLHRRRHGTKSWPLSTW